MFPNFCLARSYSYSICQRSIERTENVFHFQRSLKHKQTTILFCCRILCLVLLLFIKLLFLQDTNIFFSFLPNNVAYYSIAFNRVNFTVHPNCCTRDGFGCHNFSLWITLVNRKRWCIEHKCVCCGVLVIVWITKTCGKNAKQPLKTYRGVRAYNVWVGVTLPEGFFTRRSRGCGRWSGIFTSVSDPVYQCVHYQLHPFRCVFVGNRANLHYIALSAQRKHPAHPFLPNIRIIHH